MIAFLSLFLGLINGPQEVQLAVSGSVAWVEVRLDETTVGELREAPWKVEVDFGQELTSHRLTAIARDARGVTVGTVTQLVNVPRSPVELEILLDGWRHGVPRHGRLIWHSVEQTQPTRVSASLDGQPLALDDGATFELPGLAADSLHFLSAQVELADGSAATAEAIFGGAYGSTVQTELTAVPVIAEGTLPSLEGLSGWFESRGEALEAVAEEDGPAEVVVIREESLREALHQISRSMKAKLRTSFRFVGLHEPDAVRFLSQRAKRVSHAHLDYSVFPVSRSWTVEDAPLPTLLWAPKLDDPNFQLQGLNDAVAAAGLTAAASQKRRAVVLVTGDCAASSGHRSAESVLRYLEELRVPLHVWTIEPGKRGQRGVGFCARAEDASSAHKLLKAVKRLRRTVERQRIVWLDGRHLPREIELSALARGVELAR